MNDEQTPIAIRESVITVGNVDIPCAVLEDGRRMLTQQGFLKAIGRARAAKGGQGASVDGAIPFLAANNLRGYVDEETRELLRPVRFRTKGGILASGFPAEALPKVCNLYLKARDDGGLHATQVDVATRCDMLIRGLAVVGIIALVDEATGYQRDRADDALSEILQKFLSKELRAWVKTFPDEYYKEIFRIYGLTYSSFTSKRPGFIGQLTKNLIYERLAPDVLEELEKRNPKLPSGNRKDKHFMWLSEDIGSPALQRHIYDIILLLRLTPKGGQKQLMTNVDKVRPRWKETLKTKALPGLEEL